MLVRGRLHPIAEFQLLESLQRLAFVPAGMPLEVRQAVVDVLLGKAAGLQDDAALQIGEGGTQTHQSCACRLCRCLASLHAHCSIMPPVPKPLYYADLDSVVSPTALQEMRQQPCLAAVLLLAKGAARPTSG